MLTSSSESDMHIRAVVEIRSGLSLEAVAEAISREVFAGVPFGGKDAGIRDEVPAVATTRAVMGLSAIISGYGGADGYGLEISPWDPAALIARVGGPEDEVELSVYFAELVQSVPGVDSAKAAS
jgi:hypothetical protein